MPHACSASTVKRGWYQRNEIAITPWLFLIPAMLFFAVYVIFPCSSRSMISLS